MRLWRRLLLWKLSIASMCMGRFEVGVGVLHRSSSDIRSSPNMADKTVSSSPIKSLMTCLASRCHIDSLLISSEYAGPVEEAITSFRLILLDTCLLSCNCCLISVRCLSFSISSRTTFDCSSRHLSIRSCLELSRESSSSLLLSYRSPKLENRLSGEVRC